MLASGSSAMEPEWNSPLSGIFQFVLKLFQFWNKMEYYSKLLFQPKRGSWNILFQYGKLFQAAKMNNRAEIIHLFPHEKSHYSFLSVEVQPRYA
jgi:hypothetical protein